MAHLLPTPYSLLLTPYSLLLTPYSLLPTPYSLPPYPLIPQLANIKADNIKIY